MADIIIIGGGPAGLTAAIYAARAGKSVQVFEKGSFGGQIVNSPLVENYPAIAHISGFELGLSLQNQAADLGVELRAEEVQMLLAGGSGFTVLADSGSYEARSVILATGLMHRMLGLPGEEELIGSGISFCAVCDGAFYEGQDVAVIGGGDTALQDALFLANTCRRVYLIHRRDEFRAEAHHVAKARAKENIELMMNQTPVSYLTENGSVTGLLLEDKTTGLTQELEVSCVFLAVGQRPVSVLYDGLVRTDEKGYIIASEDCCTDIPGLFSAGDCRLKSVRQLTTAVADGANAALNACRYTDEHIV